MGKLWTENVERYSKEPVNEWAVCLELISTIEARVFYEKWVLSRELPIGVVLVYVYLGWIGTAKN